MSADYVISVVLFSVVMSYLFLAVFSAGKTKPCSVRQTQHSYTIDL